MGVVRRGPLDQHEMWLARKAVLACVVSEGNPRVLLDPVELATEAQRRGETDRPGIPIAQADRGDRGDDCTPRRRHVCKRRGEVATDDFVIDIRPHALTLSERAHHPDTGTVRTRTPTRDRSGRGRQENARVRSNLGAAIYGLITVGALMAAESAGRETYGETVAAVALAAICLVRSEAPNS